VLFHKVKAKVKLSRHRHAGDNGKRRYSSSFLSLALDGVSGQHHVLAELYPWERTSSTHWIGGWVGLRTSLNTEATGKILCLCQGSNPGRPVCSQTLYWLSCLSSCCLIRYMQCLTLYFVKHLYTKSNCNRRIRCEISSSHGGEYEVQNCLLGCTAV
jgi:hypothetical protein